MSNSRKGDELWMRKQRSFVYNAYSGCENPHRSNMRSSRIPTGDVASKSTHDIQGQGNCFEDAAVAELCGDLPPNVFDDDGVEIEDDFDEDVLTAEQLEEVDRLTSLELEVVDKASEQGLRFNDQTETEPYYNKNKERKPKICQQPTRIARFTGTLCEQESVSHMMESRPTRSKDFEASCVKSLENKLAELKSDHEAAKARIKSLEEEKFSKDGELRILRDSLEHFRNEEKKSQDQIRNMQQKQMREQSEREKELQKQIESLSTRLQFKEREVMEALEQNKKLSSTNQSPPKRKPSTSILGDVFPTGNSFFNQMSPDRQKCPRLTKTSPHSQSTPEKNQPDGVSSGKAEISSFSAVEKESCAFSCEKSIMKIQTESRCGINLAGKLLCLENSETRNLSGLYRNAGPDSTSIVSLLWENTGNGEGSSSLQKGDTSDITSCGTLRLFESQISSIRTQFSSTSVEEDEYLLAMQCLEKLVNLCRENCDSSHQLSSFDLNQDDQPLEIKEEMLVVNFLPVLGQCLARFLNHDFDESRSSCGKTSLTQSESQELKDDRMVGPMKNGLRVVETAWNTLRVLNVLCLYSRKVQSAILLGGESCVFLEAENVLQKVTSKVKIVGDKDRSSANHSKKLNANSSAVNNYNVGCYIPRQKNELLQWLFRLVVPQQSECLAIMHGSLKVLLTLASNCSPLLLPRFQPLLTESFLSQCLTKDFSLPTVSLIVDLLTTLVPQNGLSKKLCSQTDDCILLKIYQSWALTSDTLDHVQHSRINLKVVQFVNQLLSTDEDAVHVLLEAECPCSLELIKNIVVMLHRELNELNKFPVSSMQSSEASTSLQVVRQGVFLLVNLCLSDRLLEEHRYRLETEHQYVHLLNRVTRLYKKIPDILSETEVLAFQDLLDLDRYYDVEWSQESEDEEACEGMDVDN